VRLHNPSPSAVGRSEHNIISELIAMLQSSLGIIQHQKSGSHAQSGSPKFYLCTNCSDFFGGVYSNWSLLVLVSSFPNWTGFYTGQFQSWQFQRFYREPHKFSSYNTYSLIPTQANLTGNPFCYVNIYSCHSNGASDTSFFTSKDERGMMLGTLPSIKIWSFTYRSIYNV